MGLILAMHDAAIDFANRYACFFFLLHQFLVPACCSTGDKAD
jgi:hypothetical protein